MLVCASVFCGLDVIQQICVCVRVCYHVVHANIFMFKLVSLHTIVLSCCTDSGGRWVCPLCVRLGVCEYVCLRG